MKRIPLEQAVPGMVLAKPVMNSAGMVVVAAGMALDAPWITHLERMGTTAVYVEGAAGEGASKLSRSWSGSSVLDFEKPCKSRNSPGSAARSAAACASRGAAHD